MSQVVGNFANFRYSGLQLSIGVNGPVCIFAGTINPNSFSDPPTPTSAQPGPVVTAGVQVAGFSSFSRVTINSADVSSLFLLAGVGLFIKTAFDASGATSGTWTLITTP